MSVSGFGVGLPNQTYQDYGMDLDAMLETLNPPWFYTWKYDQLQYPNFVPMVWRLNVEAVAQVLPVMAENHDRLWLLGNEPERAEQSNTSPEVFANAAQIIRAEFGWAVEIALPGVLNDYTGYGRDWTKAYLAAGGPMPDAWHFHVYEPNGQQVHARIDAWKRLVDDTRPIIVSEVGCWLDRPERMAEVMDAARMECATGSIQAAAHFSARYEADMQHSDLLTATGDLTALGRRYVAEQHTVYMPQVYA